VVKGCPARGKLFGLFVVTDGNSIGQGRGWYVKIDIFTHYGERSENLAQEVTE